STRLSSNNIRTPTRRVAWGPRYRETEILTGVLEATVRDPSRSGPSARLIPGLPPPRERRRRQATRPHFHACEASPEGEQGANLMRPASDRRGGWSGWVGSLRVPAG